MGRPVGRERLERALAGRKGASHHRLGGKARLPAALPGSPWRQAPACWGALSTCCTQAAGRGPCGAPWPEPQPSCGSSSLPCFLGGSHEGKALHPEFHPAARGTGQFPAGEQHSEICPLHVRTGGNRVRHGFRHDPGAGHGAHHPSLPFGGHPGGPCQPEVHHGGLGQPLRAGGAAGLPAALPGRQDAGGGGAVGGPLHFGAFESPVAQACVPQMLSGERLLKATRL